MTEPLFLVLLGVGAGIFSGLMGIGGGMIIVPALVFLFGLSFMRSSWGGYGVLCQMLTKIKQPDLALQ